MAIDHQFFALFLNLGKSLPPNQGDPMLSFEFDHLKLLSYILLLVKRNTVSQSFNLIQNFLVTGLGMWDGKESLHNTLAGYIAYTIVKKKYKSTIMLTLMCPY